MISNVVFTQMRTLFFASVLIASAFSAAHAADSDISVSIDFGSPAINRAIQAGKLPASPRSEPTGPASGVAAPRMSPNAPGFGMPGATTSVASYPAASSTANQDPSQDNLFRAEPRPISGRFPTPPRAPSTTELKSTSPEVIYVRHGITATIDVSDKEPSLISTPFRKPKIVDNDKIAQARPMGGDIFVLPTRDTTIFIKDGAQPNSPVIGLHLVPVARVARSVTLMFDGAIPPERRDQGDWASKPADYIESLRLTLKEAVMGDIPAGYTEGPLSAPMAISGKISATPVKRYAGSNADIYRYRLTNGGNTLVTLSEEAFANDRVLAVSLFPNIALEPGQSTEVYIMFAKEDMQ